MSFNLFTFQEDPVKTQQHSNIPTDEDYQHTTQKRNLRYFRVMINHQYDRMEQQYRVIEDQNFVVVILNVRSLSLQKQQEKHSQDRY